MKIQNLATVLFQVTGNPGTTGVTAVKPVAWVKNTKGVAAQSINPVRAAAGEQSHVNIESVPVRYEQKAYGIII